MDPADNLEHNIAEVPLKDMFCEDHVTDKAATNVDDDGGAAGLVQVNSSLLFQLILASMSLLLLL